MSDTPFTDIDGQRPYEQDAIGWAFRHGITNGTSPTTFSPDRTCTRADVVVFLQRAFAAAGLLDDNDPIFTPDPPDPEPPDPEPPDPDPPSNYSPDYAELARRGFAMPGYHPGLPQRGILTLPENMTQLSGRIVPKTDIVGATGGYISMEHPNINVFDYHLPKTTTPQKGDHFRTDALEGLAPGNNEWVHVHTGGKLEREGSQHLDDWQGYSDQSAFIGDQTFRHNIHRGSLSGCLFSKYALAAGATFTIENCWIGKGPGFASSVKLYSRRGVNTFRARWSDIAEVELIDVDEDGNPTPGSWVIDIEDCSIPGGVTLNGQQVTW